MSRFLVFLPVLAACTADDKLGLDETGDTADSAAPVEPEVSPLGTGDGTAQSVTWTYILGPEENLDDPRDLGFDASGNLWVANRKDDRTFVVFDPGTDAQDHDRLKDGYAMHFMEETAALAFDDDVQMGSCGESNNTYNDDYRGNGYMGPVLWSTDLNIFGVENPIGLGSHLDMTHETPFCVGIAWEDENVYWVFDGDAGQIVRNDFQQDHGIGMDEHYDSVVYRFSEPELTRVEEAPGHMVLDREARMLYVADTGGGRVLWFDIDSGHSLKSMRANDPGVVHEEWSDGKWDVVFDGATNPGALAMWQDHLIVGDWATGILYEITLEGEVVRQLDTGFGANRLYGVEIGPDGKLWVIDQATGVFRIDP